MTPYAQIFREAQKVNRIIVDIESNHACVQKKDWELYGAGLCANGVAEYYEAPQDILMISKLLWAFPGDVVNHNIKFDLRGLKKNADQHGVRLRSYPTNIICTMIAMNLLDDNLRDNQLKLKLLVPKILGVEMMTYEEAISHGKDSQVFKDYCAKGDCFQTERLWLWQEPQLVEEDLIHLLRRLYMEMTKVVCDMETIGVQWDLTQARKLGIIYHAYVEEVKAELQKKIGDDINLNSGDQVAKRLYGDLKIPTRGVTMTKGGKNKAPRHQVDAKTMKMLAARGYPVAQLFSRYNHLTKMLSTYIVSPIKFALQDERKKVHPSTWLTSATSRTRQSNPTLQTTPSTEDDGSKEGKMLKARLIELGQERLNEYIDVSLRSPFIAPHTYHLLVSDWSQQQLRICAHVTQDPAFVHAYTTWLCHSCGKTGASTELLMICPECGAGRNKKILKDPAAKGFWHGLDVHQQTQDAIPSILNRVTAKITNFQLIFDATSWTMYNQHPDVSQDEWERIIHEFFEIHPPVKAYHIRQQTKMMRNGFSRDIFGRKRRITKKMIQTSGKHACNQLINFDIQSPEVGIAELAAIKIRNEFMQKGLWAEYPDERGITQIHINHDELVYQVPDELKEQALPVVEHHMRHCVKLRVPLDVDTTWVKRWSEAKG